MNAQFKSTEARALEEARAIDTVEVWRDGKDYLYRLAGRPEENAA